MQLNGRLVVVPSWLRNAVKNMGLPISSLIDLNELSEHFSTDDIISYHGVNKLFDVVANEHSTSVIDNIYECYNNLFDRVDLLENAKLSTDNDNRYVRSEVKLLSGIEEGGLVFLKEADGMSTLFNTLTSQTFKGPASQNPNVYVINLFHIVNQTFGLTLQPYDGVDVDSEVSSLDDIMELLLTHYKYEDVCQTQLFHRWCFKIKKNQQ